MAARILVADDNPVMCEAITRFVEAEGHTVLVARNGREALTLAMRDLPDLVLLDVTMPDYDGFEVCRRLKADERTALIPVTMLTVLDDAEHRRRGIEAGADDFLTKPFEERLLRARIQTQLRTKRLTDQLERTESIIFALALAVEAKDLYTEGHLWRLARYGEQLAIAAGFPPEDTRAVWRGGLLHDIGKIGVADSILRKPAPLTPEEYAQVKEHPERGARIIAPMRFAREVAPIVLGHHEHWDGSGYPYGLRGDAIPIGARIIAIVDAYDAMTTNRPYRGALTRERALQRLRARSGIQWDPDLVAIFVSLVEQKRLAEPTEADMARCVGMPSQNHTV